MSGSLNRVMLIGNLTRDPETRLTQTGQKIVNMSLATNERWRDKGTGEQKDKAEFHRVVIFNERLADVAERFLKKGSKVYIEGQIQTRKWTDQQGTEKYSTEIVLNRFRGELQLLDRREDGAAPQEGGGQAPSLDDEIPF